MNKNKIRLTESQLHGIIKESVKRVLREMNGENAPYSAWEAFLRGKTPAFEFADGITYVDYDEANGTLCSGGVTNIGFHKDGEVEVPVIDGDFQSAIEEMYDRLASRRYDMQ